MIAEKVKLVGEVKKEETLVCTRNQTSKYAVE
jgi:hypothetical protein